MRTATKIRGFGQRSATRMRSAMQDLGDKHEDDARLDRLARLGELKKSGVLTTAEFNAEKKRLLGNGTGPALRKKPAARKAPAARKKPAATKKPAAKKKPAPRKKSAARS